MVNESASESFVGLLRTRDRDSFVVQVEDGVVDLVWGEPFDVTDEEGLVLAFDVAEDTVGGGQDTVGVVERVDLADEGFTQAPVVGVAMVEAVDREEFFDGAVTWGYRDGLRHTIYSFEGIGSNGKVQL